MTDIFAIWRADDIVVFFDGHWMQLVIFAHLNLGRVLFAIKIEALWLLGLLQIHESHDFSGFFSRSTNLVSINDGSPVVLVNDSHRGE